MFSGVENLGYWLLGLCYAASIGTILFSLEHMRLRLNRVPSSDRSIGSFPPPANSIEDWFSKRNVLAHYIRIVDEYRHVCPSSPLPRVVATGVLTLILSFIGLLVWGMMMSPTFAGATFP